MNSFYDEFMQIIETENREASLDFILSKVKNRDLDIVTLYIHILTPSLNTMVEKPNDVTFIWREHVRSSIIRTIIENCYPFVIKEREEKYKIKTDKKVAVVCPSEEYHEIGARMITDFFTLLGYDATFVGSNTPKNEFLQALNTINFHYIALSVSNPYNLIAARKTIETIKEVDSKVKILVGGNAFKHKENSYLDVKGHIFIDTFEDIMKLAQEDNHEATI